MGHKLENKGFPFIPVIFTLAAGTLVLAWWVRFDQTEVNKAPHFETTWELPSVPDQEQIRGEVRDGIDVSALLTVDDAKLARGQELYTANCVACHGAGGEGNEAMASRSFLSVEGWTNGIDFASVFISLTEGVNAMPAYGTLPTEDRAALVHFIRTYAEYPAVSGSDIESLDARYQLSQAKKQANQITLTRANDVLAQEAEKARQARAEWVGKILTSKDVNILVQDPQAFAGFLVDNEQWKASASTLVGLLSQDPASYGIKSGALTKEITVWEKAFAALQ